jgi:parallel beta-helix repeat protein
MINRGAALCFVAVLGLAFLVQTCTINYAVVQEAVPTPNKHEPAYVSHEPFNITSDADFEIQSWPGNGSATTPYIIENLNITAKNSTCIWIINTTSYFVIRNCLFKSDVLYYQGIQPMFSVTLTNVSNGILYGNHWRGSTSGISGFALDACKISSNVLNATNEGIMIMWSNHTTIFNNTQEFDECYSGIEVYGGSNYDIYENKFGIILGYGITAWTIIDSSIHDNLITGFKDPDSHPFAGIEILGILNGNVSRNEVASFIWSGMEILYGANCVIEGNNVSSSQSGIIISANDCILRQNNLIDNSEGIDLVNTNNTKAYENIIKGRHTSYGAGISIHGGSASDIYANSISDVGYGVILQGGQAHNISSNSVTDGRYGFGFGYYSNWYNVPDGASNDCDIIGNSFDGGGLYPQIPNFDLWDFDTIRFLNNTVNGRKIGLFADLQTESINGDEYGQLYLVSCDDVTISGGDFYGISSSFKDDVYPDFGEATAITLVNCSDCELTNVFLHNNTIGVSFQYSSSCVLRQSISSYHSRTGIVLSHSEDIVILDVYVRANLKGIDASWSWDCVIHNCLVWENDEAINLVNSPNMTLLHNTVFQNRDSILLGDADGCYIHNNIIYFNSRGIQLNSSSDCLITGNNIYNNTGVGLSLDISSNRNDIYENAFAYNAPNAICEGSSNHWDNQVDTGNWWSDYNGTGSYIIDVNDQDNYPNWNETTTAPLTTDHWIPTVPATLIIVAGGVVGIIALLLLRSEKKPRTPVD